MVEKSKYFLCGHVSLFFSVSNVMVLIIQNSPHYPRCQLKEIMFRFVTRQSLLLHVETRSCRRSSVLPSSVKFSGYLVGWSPFKVQPLGVSEKRHSVLKARSQQTYRDSLSEEKHFLKYAWPLNRRDSKSITTNKYV